MNDNVNDFHKKNKNFIPRIFNLKNQPISFKNLFKRDLIENETWNGKISFLLSQKKNRIILYTYITYVTAIHTIVASSFRKQTS